jgi:oligogalacturonide lyase
MPALATAPKMSRSSLAFNTGPAARAVCVNPRSPGNNQLLYFTSPSLTADGRHLFFLGDRTGHPNLFVRDLADGSERQLSANEEGLLKSYVYFDGQPYQGFGKASVSLDPLRKSAYFLQGRQICAVRLDGVVRVLAELPEGQMTAFTHVSADGKRLCVPTTDARALDDETQFEGKPPYDIDERVRRENLASYLRVFCTETGCELRCEEVRQAWITHVQFSPTNPDWILYNHEWPSDCGIRRMWLWDGVQHRRLRGEGSGRRAADWVCHEMWEPGGEGIIYHGKFHEGAAFVGRAAPDGSGLTEIALPDSWTRYGHFTTGTAGALVTDGCYEEPRDPRSWGGAWISLVEPDWDAGELRWTPLCLSGSSWTSQDCHPHPVFDPESRSILFTSDQDGPRRIYRVELGNPLDTPNSIP